MPKEERLNVVIPQSEWDMIQKVCGLNRITPQALVREYITRGFLFEKYAQRGGKVMITTAEGAISLEQATRAMFPGLFAPRQ